MIKIVLYIIVIPIVVYCLDSVDINKFFKKGRSNYYQARIFYILVMFSLSYLVCNFLYDFLNIIK